MPRETFHVGWWPRIVGAGVLVGATAGGVGLALSGGAPVWTWVILGFFALAAAMASIANFGDRWHFDDDGMTHENVLLRRTPRFASWPDVLAAVDHEHRTWFVTVEGQKRWVLDELDGHERIKSLLEAHGVSLSASEKPRFWRRGETGAR